MLHTIPPAGEDFVATPYNVTFSDLNSQQSLSTSADVVIINDTMAEFTESFRCVISAPDGEDTRGIVIADPNTVTIAIQDNDGEWVGVASSKHGCGTEGEIWICSRSLAVDTYLG